MFTLFPVLLIFWQISLYQTLMDEDHEQVFLPPYHRTVGTNSCILLRRRAMAASGADQAELLEEERQIQEAIRLSMMDHEQGSSSAKENSTNFKRKADEEVTGDVAKRPRPLDLHPDSARPIHPGITMAFPHGALRITRTPGRRNVKNCINLADVMQKEHLVSSCIFSFFIAEEEFFPHLPLMGSSHAVPVSNVLQHIDCQATRADSVSRST